MAKRQRPTLHARVVDALGARIARGDFAPAGVLPVEPLLAAELGVSRNLLREAVKALAGKGLLEVGPRNGTRVRPQPDWHLLDPDVLGWLDAAGQRLERAFGLVEFRLIVEPAASRLAAVRADDADRAAIMTALEALEACVGRPERVAACDIVFHRSVHAASHNLVLDHLGSLIASLMRIQVAATTDRPGEFERGLPLHRELALAIRAGEADAAEDASRRLVRMPYEELRARLDLPPRLALTGGRP